MFKMCNVYLYMCFMCSMHIWNFTVVFKCVVLVIASTMILFHCSFTCISRSLDKSSSKVLGFKCEFSLLHIAKSFIVLYRELSFHCNFSFPQLYSKNLFRIHSFRMFHRFLKTYLQSYAFISMSKYVFYIFKYVYISPAFGYMWLKIFMGVYVFMYNMCHNMSTLHENIFLMYYTLATDSPSSIFVLAIYWIL